MDLCRLKWRLEWSFFPGGERLPQVQQDFQGLCPPPQAKFPGGGVLPALSFPSVPKSVGIRAQNGQKSRL